MDAEVTPPAATARNEAAADSAQPCPSCGSGNTTKYGRRWSNKGRKQRFLCHACWRSFVPLPSDGSRPRGAQAALQAEAMRFAMELRASGASFRRTAREVSSRFGLRVSHSTIAVWAKRCAGPQNYNLGYYQGKGRTTRSPGATLEKCSTSHSPDSVTCSYCGSAKTAKHSLRPTNRGIVRRCTCLNCSRTFSKPTHEMGKVANFDRAATIAEMQELRRSGLLLREVAEVMRGRHGRAPSIHTMVVYTAEAKDTAWENLRIGEEDMAGYNVAYERCDMDRRGCDTAVRLALNEGLADGAPDLAYRKERLGGQEFKERILKAYPSARSMAQLLTAIGTDRNPWQYARARRALVELGLGDLRNGRLRHAIDDDLREKIRLLYQEHGIPISFTQLAKAVGWPVNRPYFDKLSAVLGEMGLPKPPERARVSRNLTDMDLKKIILAVYERHGMPRSATHLMDLGGICYSLTTSASRIRRLAKELGLPEFRRTTATATANNEERILQAYCEGVPKSASQLIRDARLWAFRKADVLRAVRELGLEPPGRWASRRQTRRRKFFRLNTFGPPRFMLSEDEYLLRDVFEAKQIRNTEIGDGVRGDLERLERRGWVELRDDGFWATTPAGIGAYHNAMRREAELKKPIVLLAGSPEGVRMDGDRLYLE